MFKEFLMTINEKYRTLSDNIDGLFTQEEVLKVIEENIESISTKIKTQIITTFREPGTNDYYYHASISDKDIKDGCFVVVYPSDSEAKKLLNCLDKIYFLQNEVLFNFKRPTTGENPLVDGKKFNLTYKIYNEAGQKLNGCVVRGD